MTLTNHADAKRVLALARALHLNDAHMNHVRHPAQARQLAARIRSQMAELDALCPPAATPWP